MKYREVIDAEFIRRPNRFIAVCCLNGREIVVHVPNTGRCRELLIPGTVVYLEKSDNPKRKTGYSLIAVQKEQRIVNIDSQAPNRVLFEAWIAGQMLLSGIDAQAQLQREVSYGASRFDFACRAGDIWQAYIEVKGVTLEENGIALFPDAPTMRGVRHLAELEKLCKQGLGAYVVFIIQMEGNLRFSPNDQMHPQFGEALRSASCAGVQIAAYSCQVAKDEICISQTVPVDLGIGGAG
jgi:sugar fermentation stimulation protein A